MAAIAALRTANSREYGRDVRLLLIWGLALGALAGCSRKTLHVPTAVSNPKSNNSYMDLEPGWRVRITVPLFKSGGFTASDLVPQTAGSTISVSSKDLTGYTVSNYAIIGGKNGRVRFKFASADTTRDGKTAPEMKQPALPFQLPRGTEHIRLLYLVRVSRADHNMAIMASKSLNTLNAWTDRLQENPDACASADGFFCSWVPAGVAVRPERQ